MPSEYDKSVTVGGDVISIRWSGSVWVSPSNGTQHGRARDAMRAELERYFRDSGYDTDEPETEDRIEDLLAHMRQGA